ncbi:hypothetical protein PIB30_006470 [Stylosanthes scabra]|uniref:RRM domain-containing protein n=1 Tax=Stylosanthes scabra TaxID=79078 RepID=A0ABU6V2L9_9FABA|nr:hypothetical protein [Stylosanthes scabra]
MAPYGLSNVGSLIDIYLVRRMKGGMVHMFAFIRYTTKSGALKAIAEMNHTSLHGRRLCVVEARNRRVDKTFEMHLTPRHVTGKSIEVVKEKEIELVLDLVSLDSGESEHEVVNRHITEDILDEWSFSDFNQSEAVDDPMLKDYAAEWVMVNRDEDKELEGTTMLPYEILNEWYFKEINMTDSSESGSLDRTTTWSYGRKERVEKNSFILEELNSFLATYESVGSSGVGFDEGIKVGSHIKQLGSAMKEEYMNLKDKVSKLDRRQCSSTPTLEIGSGMSDSEEDFMPGLKELNEVQDLKRREAKKRKKARKCRPKKSKI